MDRSEIGPYLGGHRTRSLIGLHPRFLLQTLPYLSTSEVGRFLRKRRSGEHDNEAPLSLASTLDGQCHGDGPLGDRSRLPRREELRMDWQRFLSDSPTHRQVSR